MTGKKLNIADKMIFETVYVILLFFSAYFIIFHLNLWFDNKNRIFLKGSLKTLPSVSLIIPAYNEEDVIEETLEKTKNIDYPRGKFEIIVVDDGSTDATYNIAKKAVKKLKSDSISKRMRLFTKKNGGKASAINFGIKKSRGKLVAVMDADSFLGKGALKECVMHFDSDDVAAVTSHIMCSKKRNFWERMQNIELMVIAATRKLEEYVNVISATPGPLSVYRKDVLKELGGFDEENLIEDVEIAWRILKSGYKIRMAFDAFAYSLYPDSFSRWRKQRIRWSIGGLQTFFKYRSALGNKSHGVGSYLVPTSFIGYSLSIITVGLFLYLFTIRAFNFLIYTIRAVSLGLDPFSRLVFTYYVDLEIILGLSVLFLALYLMKISLSLHRWEARWYDIPLFLFIYPIFYSFVNLYGMYKYYRGERGWQTK